MLPKFKDTVFYEIYPNSFMDSDGDGYGDLPGIIGKLDYIKGLGFSGIWLNPIFDSPFLDGGYDIRDFFKVSPRYGTLDDLKKLIAECHRRDIRLFLDLVPGHASIENADFLKSAEPVKNEMSDLFIWNDCVWNLEPGYRLISGFFQRDGCYLVNFFAHQAAINYGFNKVEHPQWQHKVGTPEAEHGKRYIESVMDYWLGLGVDGFRVDMADSLVKNDGKDKKETVKLWQMIREDLKAAHPGFHMTSEWSNPAQSLAAGFDSDFVLDHSDNCSHYLFRLAENGHRPLLMEYDEGVYDKFVSDLNLRLEEARKSGRSLSFISGNHDTTRLANFLDEPALKQAFVFLLTMPGVPYIYYGDEIALHADLNLPSFEGGFQRTGDRMPMRFDHSPNAGFSKASKTFLPTNADDSTVADMEKDPSSLLNFVRKLIELRNSDPDLRSDSFEFIPDTVMCYRRENTEIYMNIRTGVETHEIGDRQVLLGCGRYSVEGSKLILEPRSAVILRR